MDFFYVSDEYITFLKQFDSTVPNNYGGSRPYIGIVIEIDEIKYYAPLTSPKPKHCKMKNDKDFRRIDGGKLGAINFNNMIPVPDTAIIPIIINDVSDEQYKRLLQNQYAFIQKDKDAIKRTATNLRSLILSSPDELTSHEEEIKKRSCNLPELERAMEEYISSSKKNREPPTIM